MTTSAEGPDADGSPWDQGWHRLAVRHPSPNFGPRPPAAQIDLIVVHSISLPPGEYGGPAVRQLFTNTLDWDAHPYYQGIRGLQVSAHFFIDRTGMLWQFVDCDQRAWHAGPSAYRGRAQCNDDSIGIELEGLEGERFETPSTPRWLGCAMTSRGAIPSPTWPATSTLPQGASTTRVQASTGRDCSSRWAGHRSAFRSTRSRPPPAPDPAHRAGARRLQHPQRMSQQHITSPLQQKYFCCACTKRPLQSARGLPCKTGPHHAPLRGFHSHPSDTRRAHGRPDRPMRRGGNMLFRNLASLAAVHYR